jgi:hypothetical protein
LPEHQQTTTWLPHQQTIILLPHQLTITLLPHQQTITWDFLDTLTGLDINNTKQLPPLPQLLQLPLLPPLPELASTGRAKVYLAFNSFGSMQK